MRVAVAAMMMRISANGGELLVVADETAVLEDPGEGSFDDPAAAQHLEALGGGAAFDDLDDDVGLVLGPAHQPPGIAAVGEGEKIEDGVDQLSGRGLARASPRFRLGEQRRNQ